MSELFIGLVIIGAYLMGYSAAHKTIARECKRLGGFYVNDETFKCVQIIEEKEPKA